MKPFRNMRLCWGCKRPLMTGDQGYWCRYCKEELKETKRTADADSGGENGHM